MSLLSDPDELDFDLEDEDDDELDFLRPDLDAFEDRAYIEHYVDKAPRKDYDWDYDMDDYPYGYGDE